MFEPVIFLILTFPLLAILAHDPPLARNTRRLFEIFICYLNRQPTPYNVGVLKPTVHDLRNSS